MVDRNSTLEVVYSTYKHLPGIYIELGVIWTEKRKVLKVEICRPGANSPVVMMQGAGGGIKRRPMEKSIPCTTGYGCRSATAAWPSYRTGRSRATAPAAPAVDFRAFEHL